MSSIPRDKNFDSSLALMREGFPFIWNRCQRYQSDIFETRIMLEKTVCIHGEEAAKIFYDEDRFRRKDAVPITVKKTLFGEKGVQTLDDEEHKHRKAMFMSMMTPDRIQRLKNLTAEQWRTYLKKWEKTHQLVVLFEEVQEILCRAACDWTGIPLKEEEVRYRTDNFIAMVEAFGSAGPRNWRGMLARAQTNNWIARIIEQVRNGELAVEKGTAVDIFSTHPDVHGNLLDPKVAAVEVINVIRPYVAIAWYITFAAQALHEHPEYREKLQSEENDYAQLFVQEVRRYYPFTPFLGARVRKEFDWRVYHFKEGMLVLLDVYGMLHDPRQWERPDEFWPERFRNWSESPFNFIPQGGNDHYTGHRCAGEWLTIEATKLAVQFLTKSMTYEVPDQDLGFSLARMPTFPSSGFVISQVRRTADSIF